MKIISLTFALLFAGFAVLQLNDSAWLLWSAAYLLSSYTSACSFKNYYNPMLLMLLVGAYLIAGIQILPMQSLISQLADSVRSPMDQKLWQELYDSLGLFICAVLNTWYMFIGFGKAKKPGYNEAYSVNQRSK